jgi:hypothetical protein
MLEKNSASDLCPSHFPAAQAVAGGTRYLALCQDCLHVASYRTPELQLSAHNEELTCSACGGQLCACDWCVEDAKRLLAGLPINSDVVPVK